MAYNYNYNFSQSSLPGGADHMSPRGDDEEPTWRMQPQIYPLGVVPSDEVLVISVYKHLLGNNWELRYKPAHDDPDQSDLPPSLTGNVIWLQRKKAFFRAHSNIREEDVYVANRITFLTWIQDRFKPQTVGIFGATQDLCFIVGNYVLWVDPSPAGLPPPSDINPSLDSGYYGDLYHAGSGTYCPRSSAHSHISSHHRGSPASNLDERVQRWRSNFPRS